MLLTHIQTRNAKVTFELYTSSDNECTETGIETIIYGKMHNLSNTDTLSVLNVIFAYTEIKSSKRD